MIKEDIIDLLKRVKVHVRAKPRTEQYYTTSVNSISHYDSWLLTDYEITFEIEQQGVD